jgi:hypothetical protein
MAMSVIPIVCDTVADGLACGRRTLAGCCAKARDAAHEITKAEIVKSETRLAEIIVNLLTPKCGAHYNAVQEGEVTTSVEFTTFYKKEKCLERRMWPA